MGGLVGAILLWRILALVSTRDRHAIGDGTSLESYGFDLSTCLVPRALIVAGGIPKDGVRVLDLPDLLSVGQVDALAKNRRRKLLVSRDRVIGVSIAGHARAYPLRLMSWHEVVNDTLAGVPIAVTYNPLCEAVVVFDRRVAGEECGFGVSGLLYNSNLLMYDRRPAGATESLWSQLQARAIAGPAAARGESLAVLPAALVHWAAWRAEHPATSVLAPLRELAQEYRRNPYGSYSSSDLLRFPVAPLPPPGGPALKELVAVVGSGREVCLFPAGEVSRNMSPSGAWLTECGRWPLRVEVREDPPTIDVRPAASSETATLAVRYASWFACYAMLEDRR